MGQQTCSPELKERLLGLMREGHSVSELARQYEPSRSTLRSWKRADRDPNKTLLKDEPTEQKVKRLERENAILREDKAILEKAAAWLCRRSERSWPEQLRVYRFMEAHQCKARPIPGKTFTVVAMCRVFEINRRSFYGWLTRCAAQEASQRSLRTRIQAIHAESGNAYGSRRIAAQLRREGHSANRKRVQRVMREENLRGRQVRCKVVTTRSGKRGHGIADLVDRQFHPEKPDELWVSDATCLATREGTLYLAVILDACSRRLLGWQLSKIQDTSLMLEALEMAVRGRTPRGGDADGVSSARPASPADEVHEHAGAV